MNKINKKTIIYIFLIIILIIVIYNLFIKNEEYLDKNSNLNILNTYEENAKTQDNSSNKEDNNEINKIVIYITGAVKNEGIYELDENSRISDSIEKAGGLTEDANISSINLAYIIEDGMKIHIPKKNENINEINDNTNIYVTKEEGDKENLNNTEQNCKANKININTASQTELETLPGIGKSTALKIINYRKENGKFKNIEEIKNVSGIGDSKYLKIKDLISA